MKYALPRLCCLDDSSLEEDMLHMSRSMNFDSSYEKETRLISIRQNTYISNNPYIYYPDEDDVKIEKQYVLYMMGGRDGESKSDDSKI